jgi:hypothetical protein
MIKKIQRSPKCLCWSWIRSRFSDFTAPRNRSRIRSRKKYFRLPNTSVYDAPHPLLVPSTLEDGWMDHQLA